MNKKEKISTKWHEFLSVVQTEYNHIFKDSGVMLILIFAIFIYSTLYSLAYKPEVLRNIPIGVLDNNKTALSRQLISSLDATPNVEVTYMPTDMEDAKDLFFSRKIYGIVNIPEDFERKVVRGEQAIVGVYVDASYFLMYRQVFSDVVLTLTGTGGLIEYEKLLAAGATIPQAEVTVNPVEFKMINLFNPYLGYGSFVMPAIIIVIIQQTLLIGIGMIGGTWREFGIYKSLRQSNDKKLSAIPIVLGKAMVYMSIYAATLPYILFTHYRMFNFPMNGNFIDILSFIVPYLLACIFLGISISTLFRYRENSILFLLWTSIPILLLSGASIPKEAIPHGLYSFGKIFPSSSGVNGFLRLQTMGADFSQVRSELMTLWLLVIVYFTTACIGLKRVIKKASGDSR